MALYQLAFANAARKAIRKHVRAKTIPTESFDEIIDCLEQSRPLPAKYQDHKLHGKFSAYRECHLGFNLLVLYKRNEETRVIIISDVGTHDELFG